jgi:hypothetical protein
MTPSLRSRSISRSSRWGSALIQKPFAVDALARRVRETLEAA